MILYSGIEGISSTLDTILDFSAHVTEGATCIDWVTLVRAAGGRKDVVGAKVWEGPSTPLTEVLVERTGLLKHV